MNWLSSPLIGCLCILAICCSSEGSGRAEHASNKAKSGSPAGCLITYQNRLNQLLTPTMAANLAGKAKEEARQKYNQVMKNASYHSMQYSWKTDRQKQVQLMGPTMTVPADAVIELHGLRAVTLESFKKSHRPATDEQLAAAKKEIDQAIDGQSDNRQINEHLQKLDQMQVDKQTQKSTASELSSVFAQAAKSYVDVTGIGQAASWNSFENRLYIFEKGIEISVTVDLSSDSQFNRKKAIELGKSLLAACR